MGFARSAARPPKRTLKGLEARRGCEPFARPYVSRIREASEPERDPRFDNRQERFGLRPPKPSLKYLEARALFEIGALVPSAPSLLSQPKGDGRPIVLVPGFLADDRSMWPLRGFLRYLGYSVQGWGLGRNDGSPQNDAERFLARIDELVKGDKRLTLIGWSLGGVIARIVAMERPDAVREVITLGTPVEGGPKYTTAGAYYARKRGIDLDAFEQHVHEQNQRGLEVPLTIIYSRTDAVVSWRAAIDRYNPQARHIEVPGSHIGLGFSPAVWRIIAGTLSTS